MAVGAEAGAGCWRGATVTPRIKDDQRSHCALHLSSTAGFPNLPSQTWALPSIWHSFSPQLTLPFLLLCCLFLFRLLMLLWVLLSMWLYFLSFPPAHGVIWIHMFLLLLMHGPPLPLLVVSVPFFEGLLFLLMRSALSLWISYLLRTMWRKDKLWRRAVVLSGRTSTLCPLHRYWYLFTIPVLHSMVSRPVWLTAKLRGLTIFVESELLTPSWLPQGFFLWALVLCGKTRHLDGFLLPWLT